MTAYATERLCLHCDVGFRPQAQAAKRGNGLYCSRRCYYAATCPTLEARFWEKVDKNGPVPAYRPDLGPCWIWTAGKNIWGYGRFWVKENNRKVQAHRLPYEWENGPMPEGLEPDHLCRVRSCVRPSHLEAVTRRENTIRGIAPPAVNARKTICSRGHPFTPENTHRGPNGQRVCRQCHAVRNERVSQLRKAGIYKW